MTDAELARLAHLSLIECTRENTRWEEEHTLVEDSGVLLYAGGHPLPAHVNGFFRTDDSADPAAVLRQAQEFFGERGRGFSAWLRDSGEDDDLTEAAREAGMAEIGTYPEMACDEPIGAPTPGEGIELRRVTEPEGVRDMLRICAPAYAVYGAPEEIFDPDRFVAERALEPHVITFNAYDGATAVSTATAILSNGIAGIWLVGTLPGAERRGLARACTAAAHDAALEHGAALTTLEASPMGAPLYPRMGYRTLFGYRMLVQLPPEE